MQLGESSSQLIRLAALELYPDQWSHTLLKALHYFTWYFTKTACTINTKKISLDFRVELNQRDDLAQLISLPYPEG